MSRKIYICSRCPKSFTRRWNAQRHGKSVHKGLSKIGTRLGNEANTADSFRPLGNTQDSYSVASKHRSFNTNGAQKIGYGSPFRHLSSGPLKKFKESVNSVGVEERGDDLLTGKLEKMVVPYEKLEKLLFEKVYTHENPQIINKFLSRVIVQAVSSGNPSRVTQDYLDCYNRLYWTNRMKSCVANSLNVDTFAASIFLKGLVLDDEDDQNDVRRLSGYFWGRTQGG